jgi:hypothetical protein
MTTATLAERELADRNPSSTMVGHVPAFLGSAAPGGVRCSEPVLDCSAHSEFIGATAVSR